MQTETADVERINPKNKTRAVKEPNKTLVKLAELSKVVGTAAATAFLTGVAMAAGASAWGAVSQRRAPGALIPLKKVM